MDITRIRADDWELFRDVRLASLSESPEAFGSRHAHWVDASVEQWRDRLSTVPLTLVARDNSRACSAYERAGFVDAGVPEDWPVDEPMENRMELRS